MSYAALRNDVKKNENQYSHFLGIFMRVLRVDIFASELLFDKQLLIFLARYKPNFLPSFGEALSFKICFVFFF